MQTKETRATQRLILQGFSLYTCPAAVCTRLVDRTLLDNPNHSWAILCDEQSLQWTSRLAEDDPLLSQLSSAAVRSTDPKTPHVLCHTAGATLLIPLDEETVSVRMRIEAAVMVGKAPPEEKLEAYPQELLEREIKRREDLKESRKEKFLKSQG